MTRRAYPSSLPRLPFTEGDARVRDVRATKTKVQYSLSLVYKYTNRACIREAALYQVTSCMETK